MTRARVKNFWLCRHNHPMWRRADTGNWICYICNDLNLNHGKDKMGVCVHGHKRVVGVDCLVCKMYVCTPWLKDLDTNGTAVCPNGHPVSHHDDSVRYLRTKKSRARRCRQCFSYAIQQARAAMPDHKANPRCRNGLHDRTEENTKVIAGKRQCRPCWEKAHNEHLMRKGLAREKKAGLKPSYLDWVVVERLLSKGTFPYMKRGSHVGPTDAERWVAYCTFVANAGGQHPEDLYGVPGYEAMQLYQLSSWRDLGKKYRWRELTVGEVRSLVHTPEYLTGGFLLKHKKRD